MKFKSRAIIGLVLLLCVILCFVHFFNDDAIIDVKSTVIDQVDRESLPRTKNVPQVSPDCISTELNTQSTDFSSYTIRSKLNFSVSKTGTYQVFFPDDIQGQWKKNRWKKDRIQKLNVIVVPHSYVDPSRLLNMQHYYNGGEKNILTLAVEKLSYYKNMTFIWAETSMLSVWWQHQNETIREKFKILLKTGRLEIVTGGWVIPDEASTSYQAVIAQLIDGHLWLRQNLGVKPKMMWTVYPYGHSGSIPYIWKLAGFDFIIVGRVHQAIKGFLRPQKRLEFFWRQMWDSRGITDIPCQILPYLTPFTKDSCGPDPNVCGRFDFIHAAPILETLHNDDPDFMISASALYEQYRLTSKSFAFNTIFVPIGGKGRWQTPLEWDVHYKSFQKLFTYINSRKDWNISIKFGTVRDYYEGIRAESSMTESTFKNNLPTFSGDFFTYSDRDNGYWSGAFSSRPWIKFLGSEVQSLLKAADILHVSACTQSPHDTALQNRCQTHSVNLQRSREYMAYFQHHKGITGVSNYEIVEDYKAKLVAIFQQTLHLSAWALSLLLIKDSTINFSFYATVGLPYSLNVRTEPKPGVNISIVTSLDLVFFNSLPFEREEMVAIMVNTTNVQVSQGNRSIPTQILPILGTDKVFSNEAFHLVFEVSVPPLGMQTVRLYQDEVTQQTGIRMSSLHPNKLLKSHSPFKAQQIHGYREIVIENDCLRAEFEGRTGLMKAVLDKISGQITTVDIDFVKYASNKSSASTFRSNAGAKSVTKGSILNVVVNKGGRLSTVQVIHSLFRHKVTLFNVSGPQCWAIGVDNLVTLRDVSSLELFMRLETDLKNYGEFYTDSNGFIMVKRKRRSDVPLGGNIYPITSMAFIQSHARRLTLHSFQPLGVTSAQNGVLDVLLDRTMKDSGMKGPGDGITANPPAPSRFYLTVEDIGALPEDHEKYVYPTDLTYRINDILLSPLLVFKYPHISSPYYEDKLSGLDRNLPCDFQLVSMRELVLDRKDIFNAAVIIHRRGQRCGTKVWNSLCNRAWKGLTFGSLFRYVKAAQVSEWKLSYQEKVKDMSLTDPIILSAMDIKAFLLAWR